SQVASVYRTAAVHRRLHVHPSYRSAGINVLLIAEVDASFECVRASNKGSIVYKLICGKPANVAQFIVKRIGDVVQDERRHIRKARVRIGEVEREAAYSEDKFVG